MQELDRSAPIVMNTEPEAFVQTSGNNIEKASQPVLQHGTQVADISAGQSLQPTQQQAQQAQPAQQQTQQTQLTHQQVQPVQRRNESIPQKPSPANTRSRHLSSAQAAEELGVTRHQIAMLARNDEINATMVSGVLLIDPFSLRQYKQLKRGNGRPISPDVAWAMLWMLSGLEAPWLDYQQRRRAILKLREIEAADLVWQTRKRSKLRVFYTSTNLFGEIGTQLTLSGKSTDRPDIFGMPKNTHELEGYADEETLDALIAQYDLHEDISGNLLVHCAVSTPWRESMELERYPQMPVAAVACDLAASLDPRESHAGMSALEILLGGFRRLSV